VCMVCVHGVCACVCMRACASLCEYMCTCVCVPTLNQTPHTVNDHRKTFDICGHPLIHIAHWPGASSLSVTCSLSLSLVLAVSEASFPVSASSSEIASHLPISKSALECHTVIAEPITIHERKFV